MIVRAYLICSDGDCDFVLETEGTLEELESLSCDCGCGLAIIGWPDEVMLAA